MGLHRPLNKVWRQIYSDYLGIVRDSGISSCSNAFMLDILHPLIFFNLYSRSLI